MAAKKKVRTRHVKRPTRAGLRPLDRYVVIETWPNEPSTSRIRIGRRSFNIVDSAVTVDEAAVIATAALGTDIVAIVVRSDTLECVWKPTVRSVLKSR